MIIIGGIIILITNKFVWELLGIGFIVIPSIIPKKRMTLRKVRRR